MNWISRERSIHNLFQQVCEQIAGTALGCGRDPAQVRLVVVTKGHPVEAVKCVVEAGAAILGENYVEESLPKIQALSGFTGIHWHMIGHVQSRKARQVCESFTLLHSLDSMKLARRLSKFAQESQIRLPVLLECNTSSEASKYGFPAWDEACWPGLAVELRELVSLPGLDVRGLMTMAPFFDAPELARPFFARLRHLREYLVQAVPAGHWVELSMGMSGDFQAAIQEGATLVRIGTAIMGPRLPG